MTGLVFCGMLLFVCSLYLHLSCLANASKTSSVVGRSRAPVVKIDDDTFFFCAALACTVSMHETSLIDSLVMSCVSCRGFATVLVLYRIVCVQCLARSSR